MHNANKFKKKTLYIYNHQPMAAQLLMIEISRRVHNGKSTEWRGIGSFTFQRLQVYSSLEDYISIRIVAHGPIQVLQIQDKRISQISRGISQANSNKFVSLIYIYIYIYIYM